MKGQTQTDYHGELIADDINTTYTRLGDMSFYFRGCPSIEPNPV